MKKTLHVVSIIALILGSLLAFHVLHYHYPTNILSKIIGAIGIILNPILIALVILYLVNPFTKKLITKYKMKKKPAIALTMVLLFGVLLSIIGFSMWFIVNQGAMIIKEFDIDNILDWANRNLGPDIVNKIEVFIIDYINNFDISILFGPITSIVLGLVTLITTMVLSPIFLWHFLNFDDSVIASSVKDNIPKKYQKTIMPIIYESNDTVSAYFRSKIVSIIVLFIMFIGAYAILGLPWQYIILFSLLVAILDIVPYIGPAVGMIVPIIFLLGAGSTNIFYVPVLNVEWYWAITILLVMNGLIQFLQNNVIIPQISAKEMEINPALILIFMLFLGYILGLWGVILAIPLGGIMIVIWKKIKESEFFQKEE